MSTLNSHCGKQSQSLKDIMLTNTEWLLLYRTGSQWWFFPPLTLLEWMRGLSYVNLKMFMEIPLFYYGCHHDCDHMVVQFTATCTISAYHHWCCEFESRSWRGVLHRDGPLWSWSYCSQIYNYLCNQCLSPLQFWVRILLMARCTRYNIMW